MTDARKIPDDLGSFFRNLEEPFLGHAKTPAEQHVCLECNGSGQVPWKQTKRPCPACKGKGHFTLSYADRKAKAAKQQQAVNPTQPVKPQAAPLQKWMNFEEAHPGLIKALDKIALRNSFAASLLDSYAKWGSLTDKQVAAAELMLARIAEQAVVRPTNSDVSVEAIEKMFETARANGLKKPRFLTERLTLEAAPASGRNPGALYVKCDGFYAGKIVNGKMFPVSTAPDNIVDMVREIAASPVESARRYGKSTGFCSCCGRLLTDPKSVAAGIGPICADKWGL